jgi:hypothetical protein
MPDILVKQPAESRRYTIDFAGLVATGDSISAISSLTAAPSGLTITEQAIASPKIQFRVASGTDGIRYKLTALVATTDGDTLEGEGDLDVVDL